MHLDLELGALPNIAQRAQYAYGLSGRMRVLRRYRAVYTAVRTVQSKKMRANARLQASMAKLGTRAKP